MARRVFIYLAFAWVAALVACSSPEQHPTQIGDCNGSGNACLGVQVGSGSGSSADGGGCEFQDQCSDASCGDECQPVDADLEAAREAAKSCGQLTFQSLACDTCIDGACCTEAESCSSDPECLLYVQCLTTCAPTDTNCRASCRTTNVKGFANYGSLSQCAQAKCSAQCF